MREKMKKEMRVDCKMRLNCLTSMRACMLLLRSSRCSRFSVDSLHVFDSLDALAERDVELSRNFLLLSRLQVEEALNQIAVCTKRSGSSSRAAATTAEKHE
jgi:hypothetical protein